MNQKATAFAPKEILSFNKNDVPIENDMIPPNLSKDLETTKVSLNA